MLELEYFYYEKVEEDILDRKVSVTNEKTIIFGANGVGKKYIALKYIKSLDIPFLYIDFKDLRFNNLDLTNINLFIKEKRLDVILFANFDFSIKLPDVKYQIITTNIKKQIANFSIIEVNPLDFEEFISFEKHNKITNIFNDFIKYGNLPIIFNGKNRIKHYLNRFYLNQICNNNTKLEILKLFINSINLKKTNFFLFNQLKKDIKISKDKFYETVLELKNKNILYFVKKFNHPKSVQKIYFYNPAMINIVGINKQFNNSFANFIFLELVYKNYEIFYLDYIDFYLPQMDKLILSMPFFNDMVLEKISKYLIEYIKKFNIKYIQIVTINQEKIIFIEDIECEIIPFYEWALS